MFISYSTSNCNAPVPASLPVCQPRVLALDNPDEATLSSRLTGPVYWVSPRPPHELPGPLAGDFDGGWLESGRIVVRLKGRRIEHALPAWRRSGARHLLHEVLLAHLAGEARNKIQARIDAETSMHHAIAATPGQ